MHDEDLLHRRARRCCRAVLAGAVSTAQTRSALGTPLAGITPVEFEEFRLGLDDFLEVEASKKGSGPAFNGTSCAVCHNIPTIGGAGTMAELRAGRRNANGEFETLDASGDTLFHMFSVPGHGCQPVLPPDTNVFARRVPIPLFGAGLVEAIPDETLLRARRPQRSQRRRRQRPRRAHRRRRNRRAPCRTVRVEGAARHAHYLRRRRLSQRDGNHQRSVPARKRVRHPAGSHAIVRSVFGSRRHSRSALTPARHRQLRELHAFSGAGRARRRERTGRGRRAGLRRHRMHELPRPESSKPGRTPIRCSTGRPWRCFRIFCSTTSEPATASSRARRSRTRSERRRCGACGFGGRCCTTERPRWKKRSAARARGRAGAARIRAPRRRRSRALLAFLGSL